VEESTTTGDTRGSDSRPMGDTVISVRGLVKRYDSFEAVGGISLEVHRGEVFAFLGPNGAGKTTTVEILEGFRERTDGEVRVLGVDPAEAGGVWRDRVGVVLQDSAPEPELTVRECLQLFAGYYSDPRDIDETIALVGLVGKEGTRGGDLSGGQRRRLDVALALIGNPDIIFLDEPTTGFDPSARRAAWQVIDGLRQLGKTIFLTTHFMDEAENLADRIAVIVSGKVIAEGTPRTLGGRDRMAAVARFTLPAGVTTSDLPAELQALAQADAAGLVSFRSEHPLRQIGVLAAWSSAAGVEIADLEVHRPTLEDVYLELTDSGAASGGLP